MEKTLLLLSCAVGLIFGQSNFGQSGYKAKNTVYGGIAIMTGEEGWNPGLALGLEPVSRISKYVGLGGHIDYTWLSLKTENTIVGEVGGGLHFLDVAFVPKLYVPVSDETFMTFDIDPALVLDYAYAHFGNVEDSDISVHFGFTFGASFNVNLYSFVFKYKTVYVKGTSTSWIALCLGYDIIGN